VDAVTEDARVVERCRGVEYQHPQCKTQAAAASNRPTAKAVGERERGKHAAGSPDRFKAALTSVRVVYHHSR
jgi:hypothetical protein